MTIDSSQAQDGILVCQGQIDSEADALDLMAACWEQGAQTVLLEGHNLPPAFYDLKTGLAGAVLQKFANYGVRLALVTEAAQIESGRFGEMAREANRSNPALHVFSNPEDARRWLRGE